MSTTPLQIIVTAKTTEANQGLKDIQTALAKTAVAANNADSSLAKFGTGLSSSGSGLASLKNQLPVLGTSLGDVSLQFGDLGKLLTGGVGAGIAIAVTLFKNWASSISDTQRAQKALNASLNESKASVAGEVASLTALVSIAQDASLSYDARQQAISKINKDYPTLLGNITQENIGTKASKDAIDAEIGSLVRRAQIKGAENLIEKETEKLLKSQTELGIETTTVFQKLKAVTSEAFNFGSGGASLVESAIENQKDAAKSATTAIEIYRAKLRELLAQSAAAGDLFTPKPLKIAKPPKEKIQKVVKETDDDISQAFALARIKPSDQTDFGKLAIGKIDTHPILQMTDELKAQYKKIFGDELDFTTQFNEILASGISDAFASVAESIGQVLGGDSPLKGIFNALFSSLGAVLESLGKALIKAAVTVELAKKAFKALLSNPLAAIAAGVGLVALGALIRAQVSKSVPGFAGGVQNFGGGLAIVGEQGPELVTLPRGSNVIPNNQISASMGTQVFIPQAVIRGQDIVIAFNRASQTNSRNG